MRRTLATFMILAMVAASCGSDDDNASPPASSTEQTSPPGAVPTSESTATSEGTATSESTPTSESTATTEPALNPVHVCPHRNELLFARSIEDALPRADVQLTTLKRITGPSELVENMTDEDINALAGQGVGLYQVPPTEDPLEVARELLGMGVPAAPVLLVTPTGHWTFGPGGPYDDEQDTLPAPSPPAAEPPMVAVIDTGYTKTEATVPWMTDHVEAADPTLDVEHATSGDIQGHGKFVASVIVRNTPDAKVIVAGMANVPPDSFQGFDSTLNDTLSDGAAAQFAKGYSTDEMQLYLAVRRLLTRQLQGEFTFAALNLSVGSHQCDILSDEGMAIWAALDLWYDGTNEAPVVAAAGNHGTIEPNEIVSNDFIPGQMGGATPVDIPGLQATGNPLAPTTVTAETHTLYGVQSVKPANMTTLSDFSNPGAVSAVGENVCGVRVDGSQSTWSGTSFATAVATAVVAAGGGLSGAIAPTGGC